MVLIIEIVKVDGKSEKYHFKKWSDFVIMVLIIEIVKWMVCIIDIT